MAYLTGTSIFGDLDIKYNNIKNVNKINDVSATELSRLQGVTSSIQTQINAKMNTTGGTFTGAVVAQNNTAYTTKQLRNITLSTASPSGGSNGDIWIKYV